MRPSRIEVITHAERRRRHSVSDKLRIVAECEGATVASVAKIHEISQSLLYAWRRQVREGTLTPVTADAKAIGSHLPASLAPSVARPSDFIQLDAIKVEPTMIRASLAGGLTVDFPVDLDPSRIAAVIRSVREGDRQ